MKPVFLFLAFCDFYSTIQRLLLLSNIRNRWARLAQFFTKTCYTLVADVLAILERLFYNRYLTLGSESVFIDFYCLRRVSHVPKDYNHRESRE